MDLDEQVPEPVKDERLQRLQALILRHQDAFNAASVGSTYDVLFERAGRFPGQLVGKTPYLQAVNVMASQSLIGSVLQVQIDGLGTNTLFGALTAPDQLSSDPGKVQHSNAIDLPILADAGA